MAKGTLMLWVIAVLMLGACSASSSDNSGGGGEESGTGETGSSGDGTSGDEGSGDSGREDDGSGSGDVPAVTEEDKADWIAHMVRDTGNFLRNRDWLDQTGSISESEGCTLGGSYSVSGTQEVTGTCGSGTVLLTGDVTFTYASCAHIDFDSTLASTGTVRWQFSTNYDDDGDCLSDTSTETITADALDFTLETEDYTQDEVDCALAANYEYNYQEDVYTRNGIACGVTYHSIN